MQDEMIGGWSVANGAQVTVPAMIVDWLRDAAYAEIGSAAEAFDTVAFANDREAHPEWFRGPAESLKQIYALLDAIGWAKSVPPVAVPIDLREDYCWALMRTRWALMRTLHATADFAADDDPGKAVCGDFERRRSALLYDVEDERVGVLWDFIADTQARIDAMSVEQGDGEGFVLDIAA
jgi:hypothetical protein